MLTIKTWAVQFSFKADYQRAITLIDQTELDDILVEIFTALASKIKPDEKYNYHRIRLVARYEGYYRCDIGSLRLIMRYVSKDCIRLVRLCDKNELV